jgi:hypothetical protein
MPLRIACSPTTMINVFSFGGLLVDAPRLNNRHLRSPSWSPDLGRRHGMASESLDAIVAGDLARQARRRGLDETETLVLVAPKSSDPHNAARYQTQCSPISESPVTTSATPHIADDLWKSTGPIPLRNAHHGGPNMPKRFHVAPEASRAIALGRMPQPPRSTLSNAHPDVDGPGPSSHVRQESKVPLRLQIPGASSVQRKLIRVP